MVGAGTLGGQQDANQIDRLLVDRLEVDRRLQAGEHRLQVGQLGKLTVRDGDAVAHTGRAKPLALHEDIEDTPLGEVDQIGGAPRQLLQGLLLAGDPQVWDHRVRPD